jgi:heptosyltransferase II
VNQVLIRAPNWLGDVVMSLAFFRKIGAVFPTARIEVIISEAFAPLLDGIPNIVKIHSFGKNQLKSLRGMIRFCNGLKVVSNGYDLFVSLPDSFSSALMGRLLSCKERIGYRADIRSILLTDIINKPKGLHRVEEYCWLLSGFCKDPLKSLDTTYQPNPSEIISLKKTIEKSVSHIVLHMNSEAESRQIPLEKAVRLAHGIIERHKTVLYLTGTAQDNEYNEAFHTRLGLPANVVNLSGRTKVAELARLFKTVDLVISADTGPAHLANSVGAELVVLWGPGDDTNTSPFEKAKLHIMKSEPLACRPCVSNTCSQKSKQCILDISDSAVLRVVERILAG